MAPCTSTGSKLLSPQPPTPTSSGEGGVVVNRPSTVAAEPGTAEAVGVTDTTVDDASLPQNWSNTRRWSIVILLAFMSLIVYVYSQRKSAYMLSATGFILCIMSRGKKRDKKRKELELEC